MKVVASDFDNTLYVKNHEIFNDNIQIVKKFIEKGNIFIIITGRSFTNIKKAINEFGIPYSYLVCQDGANIFDAQDNCIKSNLIDKEKAIHLSKILEDNHLEYCYESAFNDKDNIENAVKITVTVSNREEALMVTEKLKQAEEIYAYVSSKHINIIDSYVNKSSALKYLEENGYISKDITVIGDDVNDYEMLEKYDGVIMEKHHPMLDSLQKKEIHSVGKYLKKIK